MKEQFVSYNIALALKELGFDEECLTTYGNDGKSFHRNPSENMDGYPRYDEPLYWKNSLIHKDVVAAPLLQQAWKFILIKLEENYNLISVEIYTDDSGFVQYGQGQLFVFNDQQDGIRKAIELYKNNNEF